jgi:hypothetical protein
MSFIANIWAEILASLVIIAFGFLLKVKFGDSIKRNILTHLSLGNITGVYTYEKAINRIKRELLLASKNPTNKVKFMTFMGKDIITEGGLHKEMKEFFYNGGKAEILIFNPNSDNLWIRAKILNLDAEMLKTAIQNTINYFSEEYNKIYKDSVKIRLINDIPYFRLYFIDDVLFLGFYDKRRSYDNYIYELPKKSKLYSIANKIFSDTWEYKSNEVKYKA